MEQKDLREKNKIAAKNTGADWETGREGIGDVPFKGRGRKIC